TDPRTPIEIEELNRSTVVSSNTLRRVLVPSPANGGTNLGTVWRDNLAFNDSSWASGTRGIGYDTAPDYLPYIGINVDATMRNQNGSAFIRIPFDVPATNGLNYMVLRVRFDDGFAAFLNGQLIASVNAPNPLLWNSFATAGNDDAAAVRFRDFDVTSFMSALRPGQNLLAIQGMNVSLPSSDFLIDAELVVSQRRIVGGQPTALVYTGPIPLSDRVQIKARVLNGTEWSALHEGTFVAGTPELVISELHYHPVNPSDAEVAAGFFDENMFEFVELYNPGTATFDLDGIAFVDGINFDFTGSAITKLAPGARVLVVQNRAAFEFRYGVGLPIAGEYLGRLSNAGERIALGDGDGNIIFEISYGTASPWPPLADGSGPSLELQNFTGNRSAPDHWGTSQAIGGSPGLSSSIEGASIIGFVHQGNQLRLTIQTQAGRVYSVFSAEGLGSYVNWKHQFYLGPVSSNGSTDVLLDMPSGASMRFFKAVSGLR